MLPKTKANRKADMKNGMYVVTSEYDIREEKRSR